MRSTTVLSTRLSLTSGTAATHGAARPMTSGIKQLNHHVSTGDKAQQPPAKASLKPKVLEKANDANVVVEPTSRSPNQVKKTSTTLVASTPGKPKRLQDKFALVKEIIESLEKETMAAIGPDSVDTNQVPQPMDKVKIESPVVPNVPAVKVGSTVPAKVVPKVSGPAQVKESKPAAAKVVLKESVKPTILKPTPAPLAKPIKSTVPGIAQISFPVSEANDPKPNTAVIGPLNGNVTWIEDSPIVVDADPQTAEYNMHEYFRTRIAEQTGSWTFDFTGDCAEYGLAFGIDREIWLRHAPYCKKTLYSNEFSRSRQGDGHAWKFKCKLWFTSEYRGQIQIANRVFRFKVEKVLPVGVSEDFAQEYTIVTGKYLDIPGGSQHIQVDQMDV